MKIPLHGYTDENHLAKLINCFGQWDPNDRYTFVVTLAACSFAAMEDDVLDEQLRTFAQQVKDAIAVGPTRVASRA